MNTGAKKQADKYPKISIVMPCYNCVDYIERAIRSVVEQGYPSLELYIKDGGSLDGTVDIIKHYAKKYPKIISWVSKKDNGQTDAINYGMERTSGDIMAYLNADDVYKQITSRNKKGSLWVVGEYFVKNPSAMWAYGMADIIDGDDRQIRGWITDYKNFWLRHYSYATLLILNYISQMTCFWRREAYMQVGKFDVSEYYVMDYDYWLRLGKFYKAGVINEYLASFRIINSTKSSMGFVRQFQDEYSAARKHTENSLVLTLHKLHVLLIIFIYSLLKLLSYFSHKKIEK